MAFLKYAVPVLAAAQAVMAAKCGDGDTIKIASQGDADGYATCKTIKGDVEIDEHLSGSVIFSGVEQITGTFSCAGGANISSISAPELNSISDTFKLNGLTTLTTLSFPSLTRVGSIQWTALPQLNSLDFNKGVSDAGDVAITNTGLTSLDGISLNTVGQFDITENLQLKTVNVNELKNATGLINFAGNLNSLEVDLPNLSSGTNMTFRNVSAVSVPSLHNLTGQLGFWGNSFQSFSAPNLTETGDLIFNDNGKLNNISMPSLETVNGGFQIARNDKLNTIELPSLSVVAGAIDFSGKFDEVSITKLENVKGNFNMQSTGNFSCDSFDQAKKDKVIRGSYKCHANEPNPTTKDGSSGTVTGSSSSASASKTSAADLTAANLPALGFAAVFGALVQIVL
ncbi:GPI-anchored protein Ecm33 [Aspergillus clavatus NRRL 1]|uniref:GPI-anchored cell wall organization protein Ecm33 n=1 Tax=Aspergillus clavatus (strain ATCC 1007 / CBS 513.65 / DSM 816 / NCTC 3887 / NRRL 1 / QM 1276 / 107) TaxID=344612 RepID=A1CGZ0_ASPCL|nr:GPI-anchored cell wall organization protein Ecm33 [Aspergillus clavatus NRRL 1]EAW10145.1 GPI-anchored cell wall organization protein Ecm33 [Aspergillus clavatus NRRL 1]